MSEDDAEELMSEAVFNNESNFDYNTFVKGLFSSLWLSHNYYDYDWNQLLKIVS